MSHPSSVRQTSVGAGDGWHCGRSGLLERDEAMAIVDRLYQDCCRGNGKVAVISGPVGSGKSEFLRAVAARMRSRGAHLLCAGAPRIDYGGSLGSIDQLLRNANLPRVFVDRVAELLDEVLGAVWQPGKSGPADQHAAVACGRWHTRLWEVFRELADDGPLVLIIDDAHNLDSASYDCLLYLLRRLRMARVLVVLGERVSIQYTEPVLRTELLHETQARFVDLTPLSERGVRSLLSAELGREVDDELVSACHAVSGGNPRLVGALAEDCADVGPVLDSKLRGGAFRRALEDCLARFDPPQQSVARGLAIVGEHTSTTLLAKVLGMSTPLAADAMTALHNAGLLDGRRFRHPAVRAVVLQGMPADLRVALHVRTATLLHEHGACAVDVAQQLVAADSVPSATMARVLHDAAGHALAAGEPRSAAGFLRLAHRFVTGTPLDAAIMSALAWSEWQLDPAAVVRHIPSLLAAFEAGQLDGQGVVNLFAYLLWHGRVVEAQDMLESVQLAQNAACDGFPDTVDVETLRSWLGHLYPAHGQRTTVEEASGEPLVPSRGAPLPAHPHDGDQAEHALSQPEQILHSSRVADLTSVSITAALVAMVYSDRLSCAMSWCDDFLKEAARRRTKTWRGLLAALGSIINFRQGRLDTASTQARKALLAVPARSWGVAVGLPLAGGLLAATAADDHEAASAYLDVSVPDVMYKTPFAVHYLHARGRHLLANDHFHAALGDFLACGELMTSWNIDVPTFVPWRSDAAQAYLGLGQPCRARQLVDEQLLRLAPGNSRARGISLRVRAMTAGIADRLSLLKEAIDMLRSSGDRLELALAYADLSQAYYSGHEHRHGSRTARSARVLAKQCGARNLLRTLPPEAGRQELPEPRIPGDLSAAEQKVATLASRGFTNRQVANRLHLTVSTVEQHLTRIYRKLDVAGRSELPRKLRPMRAGGDP
jgi:DNA-binding CsgD family transcriptional regulator